MIDLSGSSGLFHQKYKLISLFIVALSSLSTFQSALALGAGEVTDKLPDASTINKLPISKVDKQFIDALKKSADFKDYQVDCQLFTLKNDGWKTFGGAKVFFKQKAQVRAVINSSDYRNGSVVVKQADGTIRAHGGGLLRAMTMNIEPDSRTIRLPTGYSLVSSDFISLYDALKGSLSKGFTASATSSGVKTKLFKNPVQVMVMTNGASPDNQISEVVFIDPSSKLPVGWNTYKEGKPHALVIFDGFAANSGLSDDLFHI